MAVVVLLLFFIMPALLYLMGWGVVRFIYRSPTRVGFPARREEPGDKLIVVPQVSAGA